MARKKKHPEHVNHERWLVSFADFMTLLFAFFVVMFAVSKVDTQKVGRFTENFSKAVGIDMFPAPGKGLMIGENEGAVVETDNKPDGKGPGAGGLPAELAQIKSALQGTKEDDKGLAKVQVIARRNELVLRLSDNLFFEVGSDSLEASSKAVVAHLARELKDRKVDIRIEGHTDNRPIKTARFRSNWDLSTARATTIVAAFAAEGIASERLSASGYGEFHPIADNKTDEGRKGNRRVDIVVTIPVPQAATEPTVAPAPAPAAEHGDAGTEPAKHEDEKHEPVKHEEKHH